ncbi:dihydrolipoamide acetyltransferase family protein [Paracoccus kondratievae]|uniref:Dihydrolipoamide acetyltransferase component of pyruvate dehydrogenase complex n=1 Tax=Paracoccus kondratievae TaxID=135740 RepID=A0AAD3NZ49_9RHOB|nr:dihydrolipoamide acetyltransferase family protein [Paracoccus kondratievae]GLK64660.1 dihydrolipoamide acetyltransferase component of pyruvate dehydrogenase complex [Paracoccus kondratievae]
MGIYAIRMPDIGEGIAEAEIAEWLVKPGDVLREDDPMVAVMTDKATVEIPSPVTGTVIWQAGQPGDVIAVGAELVRLEVDGPGNVAEEAETPPTSAGTKSATPEKPAAAPVPEPEPAPRQEAAAEVQKAPTGAAPAPAAPAAPLRPEGEKPIASPAVRARAREAGVDLRLVRGSGPGGRISHDDLDAFIASGGVPAPSGPRPDTSVEEIRVIGLRRKIAERMEAANSIPQITIVEEVDATALEDLRGRMNAQGKGTRLTMLPFIARAMVRALREQPLLNVHYDAGAGVIRRFGGIHIGIAAQTPTGLMVPVLRHAEALDLRSTAAEIARLATAAKEGTARRDELTGSTITITSLGPLGAIASTPILNVPEVAIVGVNRLAVRPFWNGTAFEPRKMMNLSCSFDHRVIDGWDAAVFVARLKELLETPALIFVES